MRTRLSDFERRARGYERRIDAALTLVAIALLSAGALIGVAIAHLAGWGCYPK